jgi:hypothetical protein
MLREYLSWLGLFTTTKDVICFIFMLLGREIIEKIQDL